MHLVQLLLPLRDNTGKQFSKQLFGQVREHLVKTFGGPTIYNRSPATGLWEDSASDVKEDEVVIFEVMTESLDVSWWKKYREKLEKRFHQDEIVIRAAEFQKL